MPAPAAIAGVASFYDHFELAPTGRHRISVCHGTACHVKGAEQITEALISLVIMPASRMASLNRSNASSRMEPG